MKDLEPKDGDYVRYLDDLQAGKIKELNAMRVSVVDLQEDGTMKVTSPAELKQQELAQARARQETNRAATRRLVKLIGPCVLTAGVALMFSGVAMGYDDCIPIGMFTLFAGIVLTNEARKR